MFPYVISSRVFVLRDAEDHDEKLQFHLHAQDYFGTLASILQLISDRIDHKTSASRLDVAALDRAQKRLTYLQKHYKIVRKK